jgi:hypothetical protein
LFRAWVAETVGKGPHLYICFRSNVTLSSSMD